LKQAGYETLFLDGINEGMTQEGFDERLDAFSPDTVLLETKTPIIKYHWEWVKNFKKKYPACRVVLCGDHVTYFPEESMQTAPRIIF
ncbi:MAG TPA: B12-binding domain-containing radical SAM protein, partial [Candidatus Goldiibacteriota bacterium]|nr:B12-binding domain-containing radical SAM protein [Candidatus Goldiibacteriota bacterium]